LIRAASLLLGLPVLAIGLFAANVSGGLNLVETLLGILAIISFAVIATGWTIDHDVWLILVKATFAGPRNNVRRIGGFVMFSFDVRFIKTVCDDTGHEHRACQAMFSVQAPSLMEAVRQAEARFCRQKRIHDWTVFADAVELKSPVALAAPL
jgi:hypothetical protein